MLEAGSHLHLVEPDASLPNENQGVVRVRFTGVNALSRLLRTSPRPNVVFDDLNFPVGESTYVIQAAVSTPDDKPVLATWVGWFNPPKPFPKSEIAGSIKKGEGMPYVSVNTRTFTVASKLPTVISGMDLRARLTKHTDAIAAMLGTAMRMTGLKNSIDVVLSPKLPRTSSTITRHGA